jgi:beta-hydroxyacyl-ACP dehydratase FabZ
VLLDVNAIEQLLPHRYPFLMVDRVDSISGDLLIARKMVTKNEPFFQGHYPGHPVMPGVLIVEALAQAGAVLACQSGLFDPKGIVIYLMAVDKVRFRRAVVPGDALRLEVVALRKGTTVWKMRGEAKVDGEIAAEAEFIASIQPRAGLTAGAANAPGAA